MKELNFILANRAPELSAHYGFLLKPCQISTEEVPDFVSAYLNRPTTLPGMTATEGGCKPEATTSIDRLGSHHQFLEVILMIEPDTGLIHILTITTIKVNSNIKNSHVISPGMVTPTDITQIITQNPNTSIAKLAIITTTVASLNTLHIICKC